MGGGPIFCKWGLKRENFLGIFLKENQKSIE
jgi:hypothetical protein